MCVQQVQASLLLPDLHQPPPPPPHLHCPHLPTNTRCCLGGDGRENWRDPGGVRSMGRRVRGRVSFVKVTYRRHEGCPQHTHLYPPPTHCKPRLGACRGMLYTPGEGCLLPSINLDHTDSPSLSVPVHRKLLQKTEAGVLFTGKIPIV